MRIAPSGPVQVLDYRAPGQPAGFAPRSTTMARGATSRFSADPPSPAEPGLSPPVSAELAGAGSKAPAAGCGDPVSTVTCQVVPGEPKLAGTENRTASLCALIRRTKSESVIRSPRGPGSVIASPFTQTARAFAYPEFQSSPSISSPDGVLRSSVPVDPGDLVVLAVAVVVGLLGSAELVTGQQHRDALGEEQRHEEVPDLPFPQRVDLRVVGRPFRAAVP